MYATWLPPIRRETVWMIPAALAVLCVPFLLASVWIERTVAGRMLPDADTFAARMASLGLSDTDDLIVYDGSGVNLSAPRVWWMFRAFGHDRAAVWHCRVLCTARREVVAPRLGSGRQAHFEVV